MAPWIFKDNQSLSDADRRLLINYLSDQGIIVEGHFQRGLEDDFAWKYPAFAVKHFFSDPGLSKKLYLLCQNRGNNKNEVERNYNNQFIEFVALYDCVALMGYRFIGWDKPSGKAGADPEKDCDLILIKDGQKFYADAKDVSSETLSLYEEFGHPGWSSFDPKYEVETWLKRMIKDVEKKGADFLICRIPKWRLNGKFDEPSVKQWLLLLLKDISISPDQCPRWPIQSKSVSRLVIVDPHGCFTIHIR